MLTIFSTAKPFRGHSAVIQRNAVLSWTKLEPRPEIILFGDDEGVAEICEELGLRHVPDVKTSESGAPFISDMFERAQALAVNGVLCFINADIIVPPEALEAVSRVAAGLRRFLLVGRRIDLDVTEPLDVGKAGWMDELLELAETEGHERGDLCIDWFVFPKGLYRDLPEFAIGRTRYDNWLLWKAAYDGATVVDASAFVKVLHQNHDYGITKGSLNAWEGPEAMRADRLLGHWSHYHSIAHARACLSPAGEIVPPAEWRHRLARPRRVVAHGLRFSRPWRRRARLALSTLRSRDPGASEPLALRLASALSPRPTGGAMPGWQFGEPAPSGPLALARLAVWKLWRARRMRGSVKVPWLAGTELLVEAGGDLSRCMFVSGAFEPNECAWLSSYLQPGMTFVDVGANVGAYTVLGAKLVGPEGCVLAFEPSPRERKRLEENLLLNGLRHRVVVRAEALMSEGGAGVLRLAEPSHSGHNTFGEPAYAGVAIVEEMEVPVTTLDDVCSDLALVRLDVVKLDVEGAELACLSGASETLERLRPVVLVELQEASLAHQQASPAAVVALFAEHGYELLELSAYSGLPARLGAGEAMPVGLNVLAVPSEAVQTVLRRSSGS